MAGERIDEEYYLVKRIDARHVRETEYYPDGATKREYELHEPVKLEGAYPQIAELVYVVMAIVFVVLSIAIFTAKPTTKTQESALSIPKTQLKKAEVRSRSVSEGEGSYAEG